MVAAHIRLNHATFPFPPGWGRLQSLTHHLQSYKMQESASLLINISFLILPFRCLHYVPRAHPGRIHPSSLHRFHPCLPMPAVCKHCRPGVSNVYIARRPPDYPTLRQGKAVHQIGAGRRRPFDYALPSSSLLHHCFQQSRL